MDTDELEREILLPLIVQGVDPLSEAEIETNAQRASIAEKVTMSGAQMLQHYATIHILKKQRDEAIYLLTRAVNGPWSDQLLVAARSLISRAEGKK